MSSVDPIRELRDRLEQSPGHPINVMKVDANYVQPKLGGNFEPEPENINSDDKNDEEFFKKNSLKGKKKIDLEEKNTIEEAKQEEEKTM